MRAARRVVTRTATVLAVVAWLPIGVSARAAGAATTCTQDWRPAAVAAYLEADGTPSNPPRPLPAAPSTDARPFHLFCGGHYVTSVWVAAKETPSTVATLGRDVVRTARYPSVHPAANPALGVTGLASWFWATADDGPVRMLPGNGMAIDIELRTTSVRWRFGDGTTGTVTGWGRAFPDASPVQHGFERTGSFTVEAQVALVGRVRGEELDAEFPGGHTVTLRHDVAQIRSLLHTG